MSEGGSSSGDRIPVPKQLGPYRLLGRLGQGGMNVVLRAVHTVLEREVALKVLPPSQRGDGRRASRFTAEARAGAAISHANVNTCFDAGFDAGWGYLALELLEGGDLQGERERRGGRLPERLATALVRELAKGLAAVHAAGLLHRDIKPANILLGRDLAPQLADFGVAVAIGEQRPGALVGSPAYMAPEALAGRVLDGRADIFGLAVTLFELLTGTLPYLRRGLVTPEVAARIPAPSCRVRRRSLSAAVDEVLQRALAADPERRYASAEDFADALDDCLQRDGAPASEGRLVAAPAAGLAAGFACELLLAGF